MRFFGFLISFSILACIVSTLTILPVVIFMVKPEFLMHRATETREGLEDFMRLPVKEPQPGVMNISESSYEAPLDRGNMED
jgi:hypothetical protein